MNKGQIAQNDTSFNS